MFPIMHSNSRVQYLFVRVTVNKHTIFLIHISHLIVAQLNLDKYCTGKTIATYAKTVQTWTCNYPAVDIPFPVLCVGNAHVADGGGGGGYGIGRVDTTLQHTLPYFYCILIVCISHN